MTTTARAGLKYWFNFQTIDFGGCGSIFSTGVKVMAGLGIKFPWHFKSSESEIPERAHPFSI